MLKHILRNFLDTLCYKTFYYSIECDCNQEGTNRTSCDVKTGQCSCNNGWEGKRCEINQGKSLLRKFLHARRSQGHV